MKVRDHGSSRRSHRYRRANMIVLCMALVLVLGVVGFNLTKEKAVETQKTNSEPVKKVNKGCESVETNPLALEQYPEVSQTVRDYYTSLAANADFAESYDDIKTYTKLGKYKDTYIVFARYDMKIKDIYTKVPGLGTLYVEKNKKDGEYYVNAKIKDGELSKYVETVASHDDVKALMADISEAYNGAVQSDALLREALTDLQNAYEDSTVDNGAVNG